MLTLSRQIDTDVGEFLMSMSLMFDMVPEVYKGSFIHSCGGSGEHTRVITQGLAELSDQDV